MSAKNFFSLILAFCQSITFGQTILSGTIIDQETRQPVEYVNIGIEGKNVGTVCNSAGKFELFIPTELINHPLIFSHIGYETAVFKCIDLKRDSTGLLIELQPSRDILKEMRIVASHPMVLGHQPADDKVKGFFKAAGLGMEAGTLIKNAGEVELSQFNMNILQIPFDSLKFRLNFYSINKKQPSEKINTGDIIFTLTKADTGYYALSLINENIVVRHDFICSIELIELFGKSPENAEFLFSAMPDKDGWIYKKSISLGKWERIKDYSLCFWFTGMN